MSGTDQLSGADRNPVEMLAEEFVERQRRGERPSLSEYTRRYPELAGDIIEIFPALLVMEHVKPANDERAGKSWSLPGSFTDQFSPEMNRLGDFRILREVARGGMGVVYEAVQESLGRHVALKILPLTGRLSTAQIQRFQLEARSAARLHHGNIVPVYGVGQHEGVHYYAMQFIAGHGLDAILDDLRRLRGLASGGIASRSQELIAPASSAAIGSMALARSIVAGTFGAEEDLANANRALAPTCIGDLPDAASLPQRKTSLDRAASSQPRPESNGVGSLDTSALSLAGDSQFYRSMARIGRQAAEALAYAHQEGVLHRDIKPSNILLDAACHVWVTDFGLAKLEGSDGPTRTGDIVGTVRYMAPERFDGWSDRRSDVYSLGATLYELLTLHPVFPAAAQLELIEKVLHDPPDAPRKLDSKIPRDLETIVLKAMAKEPGDRYATAQALADDLERFLEDRQIMARRSTTVEQSWRWCRRNSLLAASFAIAAIAVVVLASVSTAMAWMFRVQRDQVRQAETRTRENLFEALTARARAGHFSRRIGQRFDSLEAIRQAAAIARELHLPPERLDPLRDDAIACMALPDMRPDPGSRIIPTPPGAVAFDFDSTMTQNALGFRNGTILVRRVDDDEEVARFQVRGDASFGAFVFSPDGRYLATAHAPGEGLSVWDIHRRRAAVNDPGQVRYRARFSADSRRIALVRENGDLLVYDLATGQPIRHWRVPRPVMLSFRPDGAQIAVLSDDRGPTCRILETETGRLIRSITMRAKGVGVQWSPDATTLTTTCEDRMIDLWDAASGTLKVTLQGHAHGGLGSTFHPAGTLLASNGWEKRLLLWDPVLGRPWLNLPGATNHHFSRDGRIVVAFDQRLTTYEVDPALEYRTFAHAGRDPNDYGEVTIRSDGRVLALGTNRGVSIWDLAHARELAFLPIGYAVCLLFEASGDLLTSGPIGVWRWPVRLDLEGREFHIGPPSRLPLPAGIEQIAADQSGQIVAQAGHDFCHVYTPARTFQVGPLQLVKTVAVSPDGEYLATGCHGTSGVQVWRLRDSAELAHFELEGFASAKFSSDGKWLMIENSPCRLLEAGTWREVRRLKGRGHCFSPDGRLVVVIDPNKVLELVEAETGRILTRLTSPDLGEAWAVTFSPDGSRLVVSTRDGPAVHVWDLRAIRRRLASLGLDWDAPDYSEDDPVGSTAPPLPLLQVDYGPLAGRIRRSTE